MVYILLIYFIYYLHEQLYIPFMFLFRFHENFEQISFFNNVNTQLLISLKIKLLDWLKICFIYIFQFYTIRCLIRKKIIWGKNLKRLMFENSNYFYITLYFLWNFFLAPITILVILLTIIIFLSICI